MNTFADWPTAGDDQRLVSALQPNNPTAQSDIAVLYHPLLTRALDRAYPRADPDLRGEAVDRALIDFLQNPHRFDPARGGLGAYLLMAAKGDLLNLLARRTRIRTGISLESVAAPADPRNMMRDEELSWNDPRLAAEIAVLDCDERAVLEMMRDGTRDNAAFARRLGLAHLPHAEQVALAKRIKDRVKKRLTRAVEDSQ